MYADDDLRLQAVSDLPTNETNSSFTSENRQLWCGKGQQRFSETSTPKADGELREVE